MDRRRADSPPYGTGFTSLEVQRQIDELPVRGTVPEWLKGTFLRNGPAKFEVGRQSYKHWFDGLAMLHSFSICDGRVSYANRFLKSATFREATQSGKITRGEFGTDPCRSIFGRVLAIFFPRTTDNAAVSISVLGNRYVALTETPMPVMFDPETLQAAGVYRPEGMPVAQLSTAHPHLDFESRALLNYCTRLSRKSSYHLFSTDENGRARTLGSIAVDQPAYMHSFAVTQRYLILVEFPFVVNPLALLVSGRPFIENFRWKPERGARFHMVRKDTGQAAALLESEPFFAFHHVNAFERHNEIVLDVAAYPDPSLIEFLYLERLRTGVDLPKAQLRRYRLPMNGSTCKYEVLSQENLDFPRIDYRGRNGRPYRFVYGAGIRSPRNFVDQLVKVDLQDGTSSAWFEEGCYPGEPVYVATPDAGREDEGVVLSVVLDARENTSFLLVLDAGSYQELARASVPHHIPFGLHGQFVRAGAGFAGRDLHR